MEEMRTYITNNHPDKLLIFETCLRLNDLDTEHYWCFFTTGRMAEDLYAEEASPFAGVFKKEQLGYKYADIRIPYPSEDELLEVVKGLNVKAEDMDKSKWQLLCEAYINGQ